MKILKHHEILPFIKQYLPENPVVVEAGAFNGGDTKRLSEVWPSGMIHAFEPVPEIYSMLVQNTDHLANVRRYPYALSDSTGIAVFNLSSNPKKAEQPFQAGSLLKPKERLKWSDVTYDKTIEVPTYTLDDWAKINKISHIDFLWLDMQGYELNVLKASPEILKKVNVIFTEVEFVEAYEGQYLVDDVKQWLESEGFTAVARDYEDQESWFFGNMLFVRNS